MNRAQSMPTKGREILVFIFDELAKGMDYVLQAPSGLMISCNTKKQDIPEGCVALKIEDLIQKELFGQFPLSGMNERLWDQRLKNAFNFQRVHLPKIVLLTKLLDPCSEHIYQPANQFGVKVAVYYRKYKWSTDAYECQKVEEYNNVDDVHYMFNPTPEKPDSKRLSLDSFYHKKGTTILISDIDKIKITYSEQHAESFIQESNQ